jgi:hypothetical protein
MVAALGPVLRSTADTTTGAAAAEAALAARRESPSAVRRDRQRRHRHLQTETLPLLQGIADETLDPRTDTVRRMCATQATLIRRRLSTATQPGHLGTLEAVVEAAEARGVAIEVQIAGDLTHAPAAARNEVIDTVSDALGAVRSGPALLTILCSDIGGSAYLSFPANRRSRTPPRSTVTPSSTGQTETRAEIDDARVCLEVRW